jgi:hypothetical protein
MAAQGHNEGFSVLDDFVCEGIPATLVPAANPTKLGQNSGMTVVDEQTFLPQNPVREDQDD